MDATEKRELRDLIQKIIREEKPEQLLTFDDIGRKLKISGRTVRRNIIELRKNGLKQVEVTSGKIRFLESSLDRLIMKAAECEVPLF